MELDDKKYNQLLDRWEKLARMEQNNRRKLRYMRNYFVLLLFIMFCYMAWDQYYPKKIIAKQIEIYDAWNAKRAFLGVNQKDNAVLTLADKDEVDCLRLTTTVSGSGEVFVGGYDCGIALHGLKYGSYMVFINREKKAQFMLDMDTFRNDSIEMSFFDNNNNKKIQLNVDRQGYPHFIIDGKEK
jgi:hypothetical protein